MRKIRAVWSSLAVTARWPAGRKRRGVDAVGMAFQFGDHLAGDGIPHPRHMVLGGCHHAPAGGRKRRGVDAVGMAFQFGNHLAGGGMASIPFITW
jgi:hypothetical protein